MRVITLNVAKQQKKMQREVVLKNLRSFANPLTCEVVIPMVFVARLRTVFKFLSIFMEHCTPIS